MSVTVFCSCILGFYLLIWFFDSFFRSCMHYPYYAFMEGTGLKVGLLNFSWTTTAFNRCLFRWSKHLSHILQKWFAFGSIVTIFIFLPFALWTILTFIIEHFSESIHLSSVPEVKAVLPGINIPTSDFVVYFMALSVSTFVHELGHGLAAVQEDVQILSVGLYIFTIIPIAFVQLNTDHVNALSIGKRLRIYCAGVWHNIACAFLALILYYTAPIIFNICYETGIGVRVSSFSFNSPLSGDKGLDPGDIITGLNGCKIENIKDWNYCINAAHQRYGICVTTEFVSQNDESHMVSFKANDLIECCKGDDMYSLCFEYIEPKTDDGSVLPVQYSCLKPRRMVKHKLVKCSDVNDFSCPLNLHCLKPVFDNSTFLLVIERKDKNFVFYQGIPLDLYHTVIVDQYFPKSALFSAFSPKHFEKLIKYVFTFSMGIAFLNVVPCYGTDGHHIAHNLIQLLAKFLNKNGDFITFFTVFTVVVGTGVTGPILVYLFYKAVNTDQ